MHCILIIFLKVLKYFNWNRRFEFLYRFKWGKKWRTMNWIQFKRASTDLYLSICTREQASKCMHEKKACGIQQYERIRTKEGGRRRRRIKKKRNQCILITQTKQASKTDAAIDCSQIVRKPLGFQIGVKRRTSTGIFTMCAQYVDDLL